MKKPYNILMKKPTFEEQLNSIRKTIDDRSEIYNTIYKDIHKVGERLDRFDEVIKAIMVLGKAAVLFIWIAITIFLCFRYFNN